MVSNRLTIMSNAGGVDGNQGVTVHAFEFDGDE